MNLNYKKIKDIKISFNKDSWDAEAYSILIALNTLTKKFDIKLIRVSNREKEITDFKEANNILKQFKLK